MHLLLRTRTHETVQMTTHRERQTTHLVARENAERIDHLFGGVGIGRFAGHEIQESVEVHVPGAVGIDDCQYALEIDFAL